MTIFNCSFAYGVFSAFLIMGIGMFLMEMYSQCNSEGFNGHSSSNQRAPACSSRMPQEHPLVDYEDSYADQLKHMALNAELFSDHQQHVDDSRKFTVGVSKDAIFDHESDINPRVGLRKVNYSTARPEASARSVPSEYNDQLPEYRPVVF
jgi:hypothetical protein